MEDEFAQDLATINDALGGGSDDAVGDVEEGGDQTPPAGSDEGGESEGEGEGEPSLEDSFEDIEIDESGNLKQPKPKKATESEEESEEEQPEGEGEEDEEADLGAPTGGRPPAKAILRKYPNFFKDFPGVKDAYFKEQKYREVLGSPEQAEQIVNENKELTERSEVFNKFEEALTNGQIGPILAALGRTDETAVARVAKNFLPTLYKMDQDLYMDTLRPVFRNLLLHAKSEGEKHGNKNLINSVQHISRLLFNTPNVPDEVKEKAPDKDPEREKFEQERREFFQQKEVEFKNKVGNAATTLLNKRIAASLDKVQGLTPFMKEALAEKCLKALGTHMQKDSNHLRAMDKLWEGAAKAGFAGQWGQKLVGTYLTKAQTLLPAIRQKLLNEALGKAPQRQAGSNGQPGKTPVKKPTPGNTSGRPTGKVNLGKGSIDPKKIDWSKTSDMDILNRRAVLKK